MKLMNRIVIVLALAAGFSAGALADDTDIYLDPLVPSGAQPLVMFTLDYRANMESVECNGFTNDSAGIQATCGYSAQFSDALVADGAGDDGVITLYELIRASLGLVIDKTVDVKVGLMMSHEHNSSCAGSSAPSGCSNGAMVMMGFRPLVSGDTNGNKALFKSKLKNIPASTKVSGLPDYHPYQLKEMYFEFFRYLTGQGVYNGHNAWRDFDDSNAASSVNLNGPEPMPTEFQTETGFTNYPSWDGTLLNSGDPFPVEAKVDANPNNTYVSPLDGADCTKIFAINIGFGTANQDNDSDAAIQASKGSGGMGITLSGSNTQAQVIKFMNDADLGIGTFNASPDDVEGKQNVVSYFIMQSANNTQHAWAHAGGTGNAIELGDDPDAMVETITNIFKSILSVSTTFVAPSVPVNVFNRAQALNEVFLALFEADENGLPLWNGNLKKVVIGENPDTGNLELQDVNGDPAIDIDGRLRRDAVTFWTDTTTLPPPEDDEVAGADGRSVIRGGAGQQIPGVATGNPEGENDVGGRDLYTENPGNTFADNKTSDQLMPLNLVAEVMDEIWPDLTASWDPPTTSPDFTNAPQTEQDKAIDEFCFMRGLLVDCLTPRPWMMADPLHSRPRPVNYGARGTHTTENPDIRILIGTNDGQMRMIRNTDPDSTQSGAESWVFIPRAALGINARLQQNLAGDPKHPNATDGSPVVLTKDADNSGTIGDHADDQALAFFGMRRGGRNLYALDITDPDNPKFKWRIFGGSGDFAELTQTWSTPQIGKVRLNGTLTDVLVFGGGYNGDDDGTLSYAECDAISAGTDNNAYDDQDGVNEDDRTECFDSIGKDLANRITRHNKANDPDVALQVGENDPHGNAVYIVDAQTGALIWKATDGATAGFNSSTNTLTVPGMVDSVPGEVTAVDTSGNGLLDRIYAADTGGRVWRVDLAAFVDDDNDTSTPDVLVIDDKAEWTAMLLFNAGRHFFSDVVNDRRFFNRVDLSQTRDDFGPFDAVLIGSGDREDPLGTGTENWFYLVKDRAIVSGEPPTSTLVHSDLADLSDNCLQSGTLASCGVDENQFANGWRIQLNAAAGEKNLAASVTSGGNVFFSTFAPEPVASTCGLSEGVGRFYALSLQDATAIINFDTTNDSGGTTYERSDTLGSGGIPVEVVPLGGGLILVQGQEVGENIVTTGGKTGFRTYWHEMTDL